MSDVWGSPFAVAIGGTHLLVGLTPPTILGAWRRHADLWDDFPVAGDSDQDG
ncbi:hypothetical protein [Actinoplanes sp. DH11]|uniref:hypothetical protein n=1 Tax=Actinoplanes sp. DH11 TaxID=2857011 RepID=UPI001E3250F0|nr:hypothetical protein [Actinoplanes sp. DH11]